MANAIELARQWTVKGANDLLCADNNLQAKQIPFDTVCFHCQQAAEKFLKAFLVRRNTKYPLTHDLLILLENIVSLDMDVETLRESLIVLIPYAVEIRYPDDSFTPDLNDSLEARQAAENVRDWLRWKHPELF